MNSKTNNPLPLVEATNLLGFDVETRLPECLICKTEGADTSERGEDGKKVWYHAACLALKLMEVEDAFAELAKEKFSGMPLPDLAGKMIRRARKIRKPNAGGMARELAAQDSESPTRDNG